MCHARCWLAAGVLLAGMGFTPREVAAQPVEESGQVVVQSPSATVKSGAATVGSVRQGERYPFTQRNGDWYWIEFPQGGASQKGWIHRNDVRVEAAPTPTALEQLQGTWICVATQKDGKAVTTYVGVKAEMTGDQLTWHYPRKEGGYQTEVCKFKIDPARQPAQFDWWREAKPEAVDQRIYSLEGGVLKMGTNLDFKTRPASFDASRWVFTVRPHVSRTGETLATYFPGWGTAIDPDGDCTIREDGGKLTTRVPGRLHDVWGGQKNPALRYNAPRVLQEVEGDFEAVVRVTSDWEPGSKLTSTDSAPYNAAGLLVWDSEGHSARLERGLGIGTRRFIFSTPFYDVDGKHVNEVKFDAATLFHGKSSWLRIRRSGQTLTTAVTYDGQNWTETGVLETRLPRKVAVGVHAVNASAREFVAEFDGLRITTGMPRADAGAADRPSEVNPGLPQPRVVEDTAEKIATEIPGWGTVIDPDGRSTIREADGKLTIRVPAGVTDLWYGEETPAERYNSPRVVRKVRGDFVAQVKVTADWEVGKPLASGKFSGRFSRVAGLLVWESEDHYLRHERNLFQSSRRPGVSAWWTPPLYDRGGARISTWKAGATDIFGGRSTWLRLERKGRTITAAMSRNGRAWEQTAKLETTFPETVTVGVLAHQAADGEFTCEFEDFRVEAAADPAP